MSVYDLEATPPVVRKGRSVCANARRVVVTWALLFPCRLLREPLGTFSTETFPVCNVAGYASRARSAPCTITLSPFASYDAYLFRGWIFGTKSAVGTGFRYSSISPDAVGVEGSASGGGKRPALRTKRSATRRSSRSSSHQQAGTACNRLPERFIATIHKSHRRLQISL